MRNPSDKLKLEVDKLGKLVDALKSIEKDALSILGLVGNNEDSKIFRFTDRLQGLNEKLDDAITDFAGLPVDVITPKVVSKRKIFKK